MNKGPEEVSLPCRYFCMAKIGQRGRPVFPIVMVWPERNGSVLEALTFNFIKSGLPW